MYVNLRELLGPNECGGRRERFFDETRLEGVRSSRDIFEDSYYNPDSRPLFECFDENTPEKDYMYFFFDDEITYSSKPLN